MPQVRYEDLTRLERAHLLLRDPDTYMSLLTYDHLLLLLDGCGRAHKKRSHYKREHTHSSNCKCDPSLVHPARVEQTRERLLAKIKPGDTIYLSTLRGAITPQLFNQALDELQAEGILIPGLTKSKSRNHQVVQTIKRVA